MGLPPIEVAAIRAQGSRDIGIGLIQSFIQSALVDVFGSNVINVGNGDVVKPLVSDGIIIPNDVDYEDVFEKIALPFCPTSGLPKSQGTIIDLKLPEPPYLGDDELVEETTEVLTPTPRPVAISDVFGKPSPSSAKVTSSGGWTSDKPHGGMHVPAVMTICISVMRPAVVVSVAITL